MAPSVCEPTLSCQADIGGGNATKTPPSIPDGTSISPPLSSPTSTPTTNLNTTIITLPAVVGSKKSVTSGAAAGVGIGCFLAGILVAGLLVFFLVGLKNKRQQREYPKHHLPPEEAAYTGHEKLEMKAAVRGPAGAITNVDRLLPQPAEDDSIIGGLSKIRDAIKNHAQSYYHTSPINHGVINEAALAGVASATSIPTSSLKALLLNSSTRISAIKLVLAHLVLSRCVEGQPSFLPQEIAGLLAPAGGDTAQLALFSKWKTISGALLQQNYGQKIGENDPREPEITQALATAEPILHPFINPNVDAAARRRNLEGILKRAAQFAFLLFSQPGSFQFDYTGDERSGSMVVFPALVQTLSDEAERLSSPRVFREKEIVPGLELDGNIGG